MTPLTNLVAQVEEFASLCLPDYTADRFEDLVFNKTDLAEVLGGLPDERVTLRLGEAAPPYLFTDWSRGQLLSTLGASEKWFRSVSKIQEVEELNSRRHVLEKHVFRTMKSYDQDELRICRGLVSRHFADIPDTLIARSLLEVMPTGQALKGWSGKTDRAFYIYSITEDVISIPQTSFRFFPGVVLKNSEVGYTSLQVIPALFFMNLAVPVVLKQKVVLRRIHRGDMNALRQQFALALQNTAKVWAPLQAQLTRLKTVVFPGKDEALAELDSLMSSSGARKELILRCKQSYERMAPSIHSGFAIFEAILETLSEVKNPDASYLSSEIAGAVLFKLLK